MVNSDLRRSQERRYYASGSSLIAYDLDWEQFQAATAEAEGDKVFIWYNTLKYYHKAHRTTPVGRWILADRFKGGRILRENVDK